MRPDPKRVGWYREKAPPWLQERTGHPPERLDADHVAVLYRALRKAQEDSKNEPGAADFYYGEMEMRRLSKATPLAERWILSLYWLLSGYSLRAWRCLAWKGFRIVLRLIGPLLLGLALLSVRNRIKR